jgi:cytochrome c biogenesis protein CcmG/thiol:disulfide interchange protein DsbE
VTQISGDRGPDAGAAAMPPKRRRSWLRVLQVLAVALVAGLLALLGWRLVDRGSGAALVSDIRSEKKPQAPAFKLKVIWPHTETWPARLRLTVADGKVALNELGGHAVVINFWASWCIPCKEEAPLLAASARAHSGEIAYLGIDVQDFVSDARRFLERHQANYVSLRDGGDSTYSNYGLTGIPETYYLNARGQIVAHTPGQVSRRELEAGIALAIESGS